mmetsp:Transcript_14227/g.21266  ORF Transcript_14227/g.21266 Transcript_14227/m.21266 type:complete len:104 (+) Transcript_14227:76-387(+)
MTLRTRTRSRQTPLSSALLLVSFCLAILAASLGSANALSSSIPKCNVPTLSKNLNYLDYQENPAWLQDMIAAKCSDESILEVQAERMVLLKKAMKAFRGNQRV